MTRNHARMLRLWEMQHGACHWCGRQMYCDGGCPGGVGSPWYGSLEHLVARSDRDYHERVVAAHVLCNEIREALTQEDFMHYVGSAAFCGFYSRTFNRPITMRKRTVRTRIRALVRHQRRFVGPCT